MGKMAIPFNKIRLRWKDKFLFTVLASSTISLCETVPLPHTSRIHKLFMKAEGKG